MILVFLLVTSVNIAVASFVSAIDARIVIITMFITLSVNLDN